MCTDSNVLSPFASFSTQGIQRLYDEGDDGEDIDEGVGEEAVEEEEQEEDEEKEKDRECDSTQNKKRLLPERRSRRIKSEVMKLQATTKKFYHSQ